MAAVKQITGRWFLRHVIQPEPEHMKYVSAQWVNTGGGQRAIRAIGDDGVAYWVPNEDSDVPPWPEYLIGGGTVQPADPVNQQITEVPQTLTGGPTIEEVFHVND